MTFLQPIVLWGLPLVLLPVIIHLINRMRYRSQPWAAMRFLLLATRSSVSHAKLRQFLILLFRVLAVLALILFLGRPLSGGWLGWALSPAPDVVLILLDRSASMESQIAGTTTTRREQALKLISQAAREFEEASHLVLIDGALRTPQEIARAASLTELSFTSATDTAADLPAMLQSALTWLIENRAGTAEIWIASDLQRSNWHPEDARFKNILTQLAALPQRVRVRLLALNQEPAANTSVSVREVVRRPGAEKGELQFALDFQRNVQATEPLPLTVVLDGVSSPATVVMDGQAMRWRHKVEIGNKKTGGWGSFTLPADANQRDNTAYFVYGAETPLRASIVSADAPTARYLQLAAAAFAKDSRQSFEITPASELARAGWDANTLLIWQEPLPAGALAERVRSFVESGGVAIFFPPGRADAQRFNGTSWGEVQSVGAEKSFRIVRWDEDQGPLAKTDEGLSLPLPSATFHRRQVIVGEKNVLAAFEDGAPFLTRQTLGRGEIYFCASSPNKDWSSLGEGPVLVPMMQRLLQAGSRRLQQASSVACGELGAVDQTRRWVSVDSTASKDIRYQAGVYRSGELMLAVNRPTAEDEPEVLEMDEARRLFGGLSFQMLQDSHSQTEQLQGEIWRFLLFGMFIFLLVEGWLILPGRSTGLRDISGMPIKSSTSASAPEPAS